MKKLTDDQRRFATENHNLIYKFLAIRNLSVDEFYDIVAIAYVKAVASFDPEKASFSTYAFYVMENEIKHEHRKQIAKSRIGQFSTLSLDSALQNTDGDEFDFYSLTSDKTWEHWEDAIETMIVVNSLSDKEKKMIQLKLLGKDQTEIGEELGLSQSYISRLLRKIKQNIT